LGIYLPLVVWACLIAAGPLAESGDSDMTEKKHVLLLGASVGGAWDLPGLPERIGNRDYVFEYQHGGSCFDKSGKLSEILSRRERKPDFLFLKECAAYFPDDLSTQKNLMKRWIRECREAGVIPIPTTVVPVSRLHPLKKFLIDILKGRNPFRYGSPFRHRRNQSILAYNDWIKQYSREKSLAVLDLEAAVRYSKENRFLREDLAKIDGLHLNSKAYRLLDRIVIPTLEEGLR